MPRTARERSALLPTSPSTSSTNLSALGAPTDVKNHSLRRSHSRRSQHSNHSNQDAQHQHQQPPPPPPPSTTAYPTTSLAPSQAHDGMRRGSLRPPETLAAEEAAAAAGSPLYPPPHHLHPRQLQRQRPGLAARTSSAPLLQAGRPVVTRDASLLTFAQRDQMLRNQGVGRRRRPRGENGSDSEEDDEEESEDDEDDEDAVADEHRGTGGGHDGKADEDAVNLAGAMHSLHPFESSGVLGEASAQAESPTTESTFKFVQRADSRRELTDSLLQRADEPSQTEINIAVIGGDEVDRAGFIARALGLPQLPATHAASRSLPFRRSMYLVRLLEVAIGDDDDAYVVSPGEEEDEQAPSPDESRAMPRIDGALALYDVRHRDGHSVSRLLTMLGALPPKDGEAEIPAAAAAIAGVGIPKMLVSCRCETPAAERLIDPARVEANLKRANSSILPLRVSEANPDSYRRAVYAMVEAVVEGNADYAGNVAANANRPRALSNAVRPVSPRPPGNPNHSRASSEFTGGLNKERRHAQQEPSNADYGASRHLRVPGDRSEEQQMHGSFLLEESASDRSSVRTDRSSSFSVEDPERASENASWLTESGVTFDDLVDRLLAQPASKSDVKYAAIFLALYRKFSAPGRLLEAVVARFDALEQEGGPQMTKTVHQLRYVNILHQWISSYPGDFAYPRTKRKLRAFVAKLAETKIFAVAAKEISDDMEAVQEDDDTNWAFADKDRAGAEEELHHMSLSSTASTLIDDPSFFSTPELDYSTIHKQFAAADAAQPTPTPIANHMLQQVEAAQKQAALLQPIPRYPVTKVQWRTLMELPDDVVARELTRIDWIMFSAIRPRDLVRHVSLSKEQKLECRNVTHVNRMIEHFNTLAAWVVNYILLRDKPKHRALMLAKFMRIARRLRELNNYNALGALIAGVKSTSVHRLAATRELIPPALGRDWLKLEILMAPSKSHATYRLAWENSPGDRIPYLPLHRRDLVTAEQGNRTFIGDSSAAIPSSESGPDPPADARINWRKFEIMGDVIVSLQRAQDAGFRSIAAAAAAVGATAGAASSPPGSADFSPSGSGTALALTPSLTVTGDSGLGLGPGGLKAHEQVRELVLDARLVKDEEDLYDRSVQCEPPAVANAAAAAAAAAAANANQNGENGEHTTGGREGRGGASGHHTSASGKIREMWRRQFV